jgi:hypothetical protein
MIFFDLWVKPSSLGTNYQEGRSPVKDRKYGMGPHNGRVGRQVAVLPVTHQIGEEAVPHRSPTIG